MQDNLLATPPRNAPYATTQHELLSRTDEFLQMKTASSPGKVDAPALPLLASLAYVYLLFSILRHYITLAVAESSNGDK